MKLTVTEIQRFCTQDGPGIRTTVFLKGCPLRCEWCHNPETQMKRRQILYTAPGCANCGACTDVCASGAHTIGADGRHSFDAARCDGCLACARACYAGAIEPVGELMSVDEIMGCVMKDEAFYGGGGGITVSGGEPMAQAGGCLALLREAKKRGLSTAVETSGFLGASHIGELTELTDILLWDFKDGNAERHLQYTKASNEVCVNNLLLADKTAKMIVLRCIMVKTVNMDAANFNAIAAVYSSLKRCAGVELVPYHAYGGSKNERLGYSDNGRRDWIPTHGDIEAAKEALRGLGCVVAG